MKRRMRISGDMLNKIAEDDQKTEYLDTLEQ